MAVLAASGVLAGCAMAGPGRPVTGVGMMGSRCQAPALPGAVVAVSLVDMGMMGGVDGTAPLGAHMMLRTSTGSVPPGQVSLVVSNLGRRTHELVVLPLADGAASGSRVPGADGKVDETGSVGEASASCGSGSGDGITVRTDGWVTLTLAPGRYELVCNLANHYADGMHAELDVT